MRSAPALLPALLHLGDVEDVLLEGCHLTGQLLLELPQQHRLVGLLCLGGGGQGIQGGLDGAQHAAGNMVLLALYWHGPASSLLPCSY